MENARAFRIANIIFMNLIPLFGVLFMHWDARELILAYFLETIIVVLFHAVRLWYVHKRWGHLPETEAQRLKYKPTDGATQMTGGFMPIFLLLFCGIFIFVQSMILGGFAEKSFPDGIFQAMYLAATGNLAWVLISFAMMQLIVLVREVITSKYKGQPAEELLFQPFKRILVQQLTVILGGFVILFGGGLAYLFVMIAVNIAIDVFGFFIDNAKLQLAMTHGDPEKEKQYEELKRIMKED
ncbi:MAG: hypothetical protein IT258_07535 [Saprospiraceae bacterium]|nr:hypothetical protein [Saprospiraceae bacterium]